MKRFILLFLIYLLIVSCKSKIERTGTSNDSIPAESQISDTVASDTKPQNAPMCFLSSVSKDSTSVRLQIDGDKVTGELYWLPYQKDSAYGKFKGKITGDTISVEYNYMIEGNQQSEDKIFVMQGDNLLEMGGELILMGDKMVIKQPAKVKVRNRLTKIDCGKLKFPTY